MSKIVKNSIFYLFVCLLVFIAFFLGYSFSQRKIFLEKNDKVTNQVNIEIMKTKLKITKNNDDIEVFVNGEMFETGSFELMKE